MSDSPKSSGGIGLAGALFIVFATLKLAEVEPVADWSWWWVTSPLWISVLFSITIGVGIPFLVLGIPAIIDKLRNRE